MVRLTKKISNSKLVLIILSFATIRNYDDYEKFVNQYGVRRTNPEFWELVDWFLEEQARNKPILSGLFDLNP
jgi:hypothetical protein